MADKNPMSNFLAKFAVLKGASRELWIAFTVKFLNIAAYAVTNSTLVLWLSSDFGFSDQKALGLVAAWSLTMAIGTLLVGSLTDALGMRRTFFLGAWVCLAARTVMIFSTTPWLAIAAGMFPLAIGEALGGPVLVASGRKYSTTKQRSMSFSILYMMMNVGFLVAGYAFDWVRQGLGEHGHWTLPLIGVTLTTYRALFVVSWVFSASQLPLLWFVRRGAEMTDDGVKIVERTVAPRGNLLAAFWATVHDSARDTVRFFRSLLKEQGFYRLLVFLILIAFLKLILMQMYYVFPEFGIRVLGPGAPVGHLFNINPWFVIFLVPIVGALTQKLPAYRMVIVGGILTAGSVFIMAMPTQWFQGAANGTLGDWIGHGYLGLTGPVHPYYVMIALFVIIYSFGEAFYSPRVYEYAAAIAPKGQEASYSALSYIPLLLAKLMIGTFSGTLLANYCPAHGERHPETMWLFVALTASIAPVGLILLRRLIRVHEAGRQE
jgi:MFS family permease